ncbi:peptidoglycan DD-metalloendopeptidase family protein [Paraburkholderia solisilvae]|uniref:LysM domain-containing protein n=1 Tax=Paraburkholderia solisilvae TaxID=624376 RepID=A0A6J5E1E3_9BURK|nr:peptidoglycan DD-metalloendopeptidase family protein [Paraburkholderia solisilvae]CAB3760219.1 hypothetical protein LMG29739_03330 [Paraburkholderia solisilvae]
MSNRRFDRGAVGLVAVALAVAMGGCVDVAQQQGADAVSGVRAASAPDAAAAASDAAAAAIARAASAPAPAAAKPATQVAVAKPATYKVRRGDTLKRIAQKHDITVKQLLAWNRLKASSRVKPGQTLIVSSPDAAHGASVAAAGSATGVAAGAAASTSTSAAPNSATGAATSAPTSTAGSTPAADAASAAAQSFASASSVPPPTPEEAREVSAALSRHASGVALAWPAQGSVVEGFQPGETRGIEIGGKPGDPVRAAADGKVMYAGTGLNEYGSLIIVQHNKDFLTAYSHNRKLLVKMGDIVRKGQQIAEMGSENNSRVSVGFEVRRDGKPVDPMPYLPHSRG